MKAEFRNIKGTFDILPYAYTSDETGVPGVYAWLHVEATIRDIMSRFSFEEVRTPVLEPTELIARGIGELTDIVTKEMFAFSRGDTNYVMRPEITAPVMRAYLQHSMDQRGGAQRLFYIGPCFRAERPQKGRYRQFHQFGSELIGSPDPLADVETIACMMAVYDELKITNLKLRLNTLGDASARPRYKAALRGYLEPFEKDLTVVSRERLRTNPLRILDTKVEHERKIITDAPRMIDFVSKESQAHYERVKVLLSMLDISFDEDPFLVRGLDYYTETAFELESPDLGAQSALAGGGRYDMLSRDIGDEQSVPAVGFAAGIERMFLALAASSYEYPARTGPDLFIVALGPAAQEWAVRFARKARQEDARVAFDVLGRSMKAQMKEANRSNARLTLIVGDRELAESSIVVRDMGTGRQQRVNIDGILSFLTTKKQVLNPID